MATPDEQWKKIYDEAIKFSSPNPNAKGGASFEEQGKAFVNAWSSANNAILTDSQRAEARRKASAAQAGKPANPGVSNTGGSRSADGLISYDQYGRQLDSLGHVAYGSWGGGSGGGGGAGSPLPGVPGAAPGFQQPLYGMIDPVTGLQIRPFNYALGSGVSNYNPIGTDYQFQLPFADGTQDPVPWANLSDAQFQRAAAYYNLQLPQQQFAQNSYQYKNDFDEAKRRYDQEFPWTKKRDAYSVAGAAFLPNARFLAA